MRTALTILAGLLAGAFVALGLFAALVLVGPDPVGLRPTPSPSVAASPSTSPAGSPFTSAPPSVALSPSIAEPPSAGSAAASGSAVSPSASPGG